MNETILQNNWVKFLGSAMKEQGCPVEIRTQEDVLQNLYYISKEDSRGSRYIPLQYKRIVEKLICGLFHSTLEYEDGKDVYFEEIDGIKVCCANVYWVTYDETGERKVLGHGFHALALNEVLSGVFMSNAERISKWKATCIGGAKSRALHDGGIGLEFYGDIFSPEINLDEEEVKPIEPKKKEPLEKEHSFSADGMPIPAPKRGRKKKIEPVEVVEEVIKVEEPTDMSLEVAKSLSADAGNYAGMKLGDIYEMAPKNLIFLARNSKNPDIIHAATILIHADKELSEKYAI